MSMLKLHSYVCIICSTSPSIVDMIHVDSPDTLSTTYFTFNVLPAIASALNGTVPTKGKYIS